MGNNYTEYFVQLVNARTKQAIDDDTGVCNVLTVNSPVEVTIYSDDTGTAASNPMTMTNGVIRFFTVNTVTSVDLSILTAAGQAVFVENLTSSQHRVDIDTEMRSQLLVIPFAASDNVETDTGFDLPAKCRIDPFKLGMRVVTIDATETIEVGLLSSESGGDLDGFIDAASVATAGYVNLIPQITDGTTIDYVGTNYVGALLATSIAGADAVATVGGWTPMCNYVTDGTAKSITYTGSVGSDTAAGYIIIGYDLLP